MPGNQNTQVSGLCVVKIDCSGPSSSSPEGTICLSKETPLPAGKKLAPIAS